MKEFLRTSGTLLLLNLFPSVIIPLLTAHYKWMSDAESALLGLLIWLSLTLAALLNDVRTVKEQRACQIELWDAQSSFDVHLNNVRRAYSSILAKTLFRPDLFVRFFDDRIAELEHSIVETANSNLMHLERSHVVSLDVLLGSFTGTAFDVFRPIHFLSDNDFLFDIYARHYFNEVYTLVKEGKLKAVKRIMVYSADSELADPRAVKLMRFHSVTPGYEYRILRLTDYTRLLRDYRLDVPRDFGIYGDRYLYCAVVNRSENIVGYWQRETDVVKRFTDFFEMCWRSPACSVVKTIDSKSPFSIDDLYA